MRTINKTLFLKGMNCAKYLYLEYNHPKKKESIKDNLAISNGKLVGLFGQELYKGGLDLTEGGVVYGDNLVSKTTTFVINDGIYYEAAFKSNCGRYMCQSDVLCLSQKNNRVVEFKSSTRLKLPMHIYDIGWQWKVISESGFDKRLKFFMAHLNSSYIREGGIDIEKLFIHEDVTKKAEQVQFIIDKHLKEFEKILSKSNTPNIKVGKQCTSPNKCEFYNHCWKNVPKTSLINMTGIRKHKLAALERAGIEDVQEIPLDIELSEKHRIQIEVAITQKVRINTGAISRFINDIETTSPLTFMDFETMMPPVPLYDGCYPYMHLLFQYCIIQRKNLSCEYETKEFIAKPNRDPRRDFIENLLSDLNVQGTILVYNESFEKTRLRELGEQFPEYAEAITNVIDRIKDLSIPFKEKYYYHPDFNGRYSIKVVLPVLIPDLNYNQLAIQNGAMAMEQYALLNNSTPEINNYIIKSLREYCYMDVLAMVKIYEALQKLVKK